MRAYYSVGGWIPWAAACGLTLLSTGCYSSGTGWSAPKFSSMNPFSWGHSSAAVADSRGGPQLPASTAQPAYPRTSQAAAPQLPTATNNYNIGAYNMAANGNPAGSGAAAAPTGPVAITPPNPAAPPAGVAGLGATPPGTASPGATNQGFYNENAYSSPPATTQPAGYVADARGQFGPGAAPANFESQPAPPANPAPAWPSNPAPPAGFPNPGFEAPPTAGAPAWPNGPASSPAPAAPAWPGANATNLSPESGPATNPAAPPQPAPGFSDNTSSGAGFGPATGAVPPAAAPTPPPAMTYLGDSPAQGNTIGSLPSPVTPAGTSTSPQHREDPQYRPGTTKNYLPATPNGVAPANFERPAPGYSWPNR